MILQPILNCSVGPYNSIECKGEEIFFLLKYESFNSGIDLIEFELEFEAVNLERFVGQVFLTVGSDGVILSETKLYRKLTSETYRIPYRKESNTISIGYNKRDSSIYKEIEHDNLIVKLKSFRYIRKYNDLGWQIFVDGGLTAAKKFGLEGNYLESQIVHNFINEVFESIEEGRPFSIIRIGDGEGRLIGYPNTFNACEIIDQVISYQFGEKSVNLLMGLGPNWAHSAISDLRMLLIESVKNADYIGIPVVDFYHDKSNFNGKIAYTCSITFATTMAYEHQKKFLGVNIFQLLAVNTNFLHEIISKARKVVLISWIDLTEKIPLIFRDKYTWIKIPAHKSWVEEDSEPLYPLVYKEVLQRIKDIGDISGVVFMVGAGIIGKYFCYQIKLLGGIAFDIGSVVDSIAKAGLPYAKSNEVSRIDNILSYRNFDTPKLMNVNKEAITELIISSSYEDLSNILNEVSPNNSNFNYWKGIALFGLGMPQKAIKFLEQSVLIGPENLYAKYMACGDCSYELRNFVLALDFYERAKIFGGGLNEREDRIKLLRLMITGDRNFLEGIEVPQLPSIDNSLTIPVIFRLPPPSAQNNNVAVLSIDDGPSPDITPIILDELRNFNVKATFFVLGESAELLPDLMQRIIEDGHDVYSHSYSHPLFQKIDNNEIVADLEKCEQVLKKYRPTPKPYFLRLPGGMGWNDKRVNNSIASWNPDAIIVHWSIDPRDYEGHKYAFSGVPPEDEARLRATSLNFKTFSGEIILSHDKRLGDTPRSVDYVKNYYQSLLSTAQSQNMLLVTLSSVISKVGDFNA